ncbi:NAD(P)H-quinone oxidoreductase [Deltaproteobacteria bacterium TL4]
MKAVTLLAFGEAENLRLTDIERPTLGPRDLLVKVKAAGVNRADILQRRGHYAPPPGDSEILGLEIAGDVEALGLEVEGFQKGDRVFGLITGGGYAEYASIDARMAIPMPEGWSYPYAAAIPEVFYTANETLFTLGQLTAGEVVLIHAGGSGVGTAGTQMAHYEGAKVFVTAGSPQKIERSRKLGSFAGIDYKTQDFVEEIKKWTDGDGVHLVLDFIGAAYLHRNIKILKHQGRLVLVGLMGGIKAEINLALVISKRIKIFGSIMRSLPLAEKIAIKERFVTRWLPVLLEGSIHPVIDTVFPLEKVKAAHQYMENNQHFGKIILALE